MTRRAAPFLALLLAAPACERHPVAPRPFESAPSFVESTGLRPPSYTFGDDSREIGVNTGEGVQPTGLTCDHVGRGLRRCTGFLASDLDQTRLDVTLDVPNGFGPHPLVVLLHGWAGSKSGSSDIATDLLADGFAVLRYSARGFGNSYGLVNLADVGVEIADLRSMIGQVVEIESVVDKPQFALRADAVAVTGASYGGGQSWLAALQPVFRRTAMSPEVRIRAIVPIVPWSDLLYSLVPNGHPRYSIDPPGALKFSYVNALYSSGCRNPPVCDNYPAYLKTWHAWLNSAEPTREDPIYVQIRDGLAGYRSIWWQKSFWKNAATNRLPVFLIEGFTDDLFTLEEAKRMLLALEKVAPGYPITAYFGDIGHPRARNEPREVSYALGLIRTWLKSHMNDVIGDEPAPVIHAAVTGPAGQPFPGEVITAPTYSALASRVVSYTFPQDFPKPLANPVSGSTSGPLSDPLLQAGAATIPAAGELKPYPGLPPLPNVPDPTAATYEVRVEDLDGGQSVLIAGQPAVTVHLATAAPRFQVNVRMYDVAGSTRELITRGTYTHDDGIAVLRTLQITVPTAGNLWRVPLGHSVQIEITHVDAPYIKPSAVPATTTVSKVELSLPVR